MTEVPVALLSVPAPVGGEMVQFTPWLEGSPVTVALIVAVPPAPTVLLSAEAETEMAFSVMATEADLLLSATAVAVMVTFTLLAGGVLGA